MPNMTGPDQAKFEISLDRTSQSYMCGSDDTLLRAGLRAGLNLPYECNVGQCGSCKIQLVEGDVASPMATSSVLSPRDLERGRRLACQSIPQSNCRIRFLGARADEAVATAAPERSQARLISHRDLTHDIREFRFQTDGPAHFLPGQYALLDLPGVSGSRAYSMANLPNEIGEWHFIVRKVPDGSGTSHLFEAKAGDVVTLDAPYGHAILRETSDRNVCCIAGGSGLAPMLSITRAFDASPAYATSHLQFLFGGRTAADICGMPQLQELAAFGQRIFFHSAVSATEPASSGDIPQKFIHELLLDEFHDRLQTFDFYCAGPPKMIEAVTAALRERDVSADRIRYDRFF
jgi:toluene monooxygenase electron transfer component